MASPSETSQDPVEKPPARRSSRTKPTDKPPKPNSKREQTRTDKAVAAIGGLAFIAVLLIAAYLRPDPSGFQYLIFRTTLALGAGGFAVNLPGSFGIHLANGVKATGALGIFVAVYFLNPTALVKAENPFHDVKTSELSGLLVQSTGESRAQLLAVASGRLSSDPQAITRVLAQCLQGNPHAAIQDCLPLLLDNLSGTKVRGWSASSLADFYLNQDQDDPAVAAARQTIREALKHIRDSNPASYSALFDGGGELSDRKADLQEFKARLEQAFGTPK